MRYIQQGVLQSAEERKRFRYAPRFAPAGQSTQMIVGATADTDKDILRLSLGLYQTTYDEACLLFGIHSGKCV